MTVRTKDGETIRVLAFVYWLLLLSDYLINNNEKMAIIVRTTVIFFIVICNFSITVPSQPPSGFTLAATTSESITASWQLPPKDSRNGIIIGYKLFYKEKGSSKALSTQSTFQSQNFISGVYGFLNFVKTHLPPVHAWL